MSRIGGVGLVRAAHVVLCALNNIPAWSIDSQIVVTAPGFLALRLFCSRERAHQARYKEFACRNASARFGIPGLAILMAAVAHAGYMNGPSSPRGWWTVVLIAPG
ncbi:MAG TPA: hypothetical protein VLZ89_05700 [Anaerolineales bacterium]|nr:hypothetical protein [Anaerolineales bacterium]